MGGIPDLNLTPGNQYPTNPAYPTDEAVSIPAGKDLGAIFSLDRLQLDVTAAASRPDICSRRVNTPVSGVSRGRREEGGGRVFAKNFPQHRDVNIHSTQLPAHAGEMLTSSGVLMSEPDSGVEWSEVSTRILLRKQCRLHSLKKRVSENSKTSRQ